MWAHQYNQEPNQVECSLHHKPWVSDGPESNLYGLAPNFGCCTANFSQGWPKFAASLFLLSGSSDADAGLAAAAYAPCELRTILRGVPIHIIEETDYPFRGVVRFTVNPASPVEFPFLLRIPAWASDGATYTVNQGWIGPHALGLHAVEEAAPKNFFLIPRIWRAGDLVELTLPMQPRVTRWFNNSIAIERGPLVFSYAIGEDWVKLRDQGMTADWQVFPTAPWNYALELDPADPARSIKLREGDFSNLGRHSERSATALSSREVEEPASAGAPSIARPYRAMGGMDHPPATGSPFSRHDPPVTLEVKARKLPAWQADDGAANPLPQSPVASDQPLESLTLIPYAAAKLRITAFPQSGK